MSGDKRWVNPNDPGILRKKADTETELLVFGYACKLFRDDQKALELDQGKHLIPWMGNDTLKIDRYDARGHLSELSQLEACNQDYVMTADEKKIEQLCDEERYRALTKNEEEQEMYREEELKRLKQALSTSKAYGQVAYQYTDSESAKPAQEEQEEPVEEDSEPFLPSPLLDIPPNMVLPKSIKENLVIEKTATTVTKHGPQVEILIKTRQANNQKLNFLHIGSPLNPYYNYILGLMKTGRYRSANENHTHSSTKQEYDHYLHPSLAPAPSSVESAPSIPSIPYKPSSDCSYNQLVSKILHVKQSQELNLESTLDEAGPSTVEEVAPHTLDVAGPSTWAYDAPLCSAVPADTSNSPPSKRRRRRRQVPVENVALQMPKMFTIPPPEVREVISRLITFAHSILIHPSDIARKLLLMNKKNMEFVEPNHKYHEYYIQQLQETFKENIIQNPMEEFQNMVSGDQILNTDAMVNLNSERRIPGQPIIHSTAPFVSVNGRIVDPHVQGFQSEMYEAGPSASILVPEPMDLCDTQTTSEENTPPPPPSSKPSVYNGMQSHPQHVATVKPAPVCFSIKKPKEAERLGQLSAFPVEESSTETEGEEEKQQTTKSTEAGDERNKDDSAKAGKDKPAVKDKSPKDKTPKEKDSKHKDSKDKPSKDKDRKDKESKVKSPKDKSTKDKALKDKESRVKAVKDKAVKDKAQKEKDRSNKPEKQNSNPVNSSSSTPSSAQRKWKHRQSRFSDKMANGKVSSSKSLSNGHRSRSKDKDSNGEKKYKDHSSRSVPNKNKDDKDKRESGSKSKKEKSSDLPPLPKEPAPATPPPPPSPPFSPMLSPPTSINDMEALIKKREERKRKAKGLVEQYKLTQGLSTLLPLDGESVASGSHPLDFEPVSSVVKSPSITSPSGFIEEIPIVTETDSSPNVAESNTKAAGKPIIVHVEEDFRQHVKKSLQEMARSMTKSQKEDSGEKSSVNPNPLPTKDVGTLPKTNENVNVDSKKEYLEKNSVLEKLKAKLEKLPNPTIPISSIRSSLSPSFSKKEVSNSEPKDKKISTFTSSTDTLKPFISSTSTHDRVGFIGIMVDDEIPKKPHKKKKSHYKKKKGKHSGRSLERKRHYDYSSDDSSDDSDSDNTSQLSSDKSSSHGHRSNHKKSKKQRRHHKSKRSRKHTSKSTSRHKRWSSSSSS